MKKIIILALLGGMIFQLPVDAMKKSETNWGGLLLAAGAVLGTTVLLSYWNNTDKIENKAKDKIEKNEAKKVDVVGFNNPGNECYFNALLSSLFYIGSFTSVLRLYRKEIADSFDTELKKLKNDQFDDEAKKMLTNYVHRLAGLAKDENSDAIKKEELVWDKLFVFFKSLNKVEIKDKPLLQSFLVVELLRIAIEIHEKKSNDAIKHEKLTHCMCKLGNLQVGGQEDSSEASYILFDALESIKNNGDKKPVLSKMLGFRLREKCTCLDCQKTWLNEPVEQNHIYIFPFAIPGYVKKTMTLKELFGANKFFGKSKPHAIKLELCEHTNNLIGFLARTNKKIDLKMHDASGDYFTEAIHCKYINSLRQQVCTLLCNTGILPNIFGIYINRMLTGAKNRVSIQIPLKFNIDEYLESKGSDNGNYRLKSVILHSGNACGGHYTSLVRLGKKWHVFNDSSCYEMEEKSVKKILVDGDYSGGQEPTIFFYERCKK